MVEQKVTYTLEVDGKFIIIENVPARVCLGCNGRFGFEWRCATCGGNVALRHPVTLNAGLENGIPLSPAHLCRKEREAD